MTQSINDPFIGIPLGNLTASSFSSSTGALSDVKEKSIPPSDFADADPLTLIKLMLECVFGSAKSLFKVFGSSQSESKYSSIPPSLVKILTSFPWADIGPAQKLLGSSPKTCSSNTAKSILPFQERTKSLGVRIRYPNFCPATETEKL